MHYFAPYYSFSKRLGEAAYRLWKCAMYSMWMSYMLLGLHWGVCCAQTCGHLPPTPSWQKSHPSPNDDVRTNHLPMALPPPPPCPACPTDFMATATWCRSHSLALRARMLCTNRTHWGAATTGSRCKSKIIGRAGGTCSSFKRRKFSPARDVALRRLNTQQHRRHRCWPRNNVAEIWWNALQHWRSLCWPRNNVAKNWRKVLWHWQKHCWPTSNWQPSTLQPHVLRCWWWEPDC